MIQHRTMLKTADNTGIKKMMLIQVYGGSRRRWARIGDLIKCVVKEADPTSTFKKSTQVVCVVVRTKKEQGRSDGSHIRFDDNAAVVVDNRKDKNPKGTRIFGPVARELKDFGFNRLVSMAPEVL